MMVHGKKSTTLCAQMLNAELSLFLFKSFSVSFFHCLIIEFIIRHLRKIRHFMHSSKSHGAMNIQNNKIKMERKIASIILEHVVCHCYNKLSYTRRDPHTMAWFSGRFLSNRSILKLKWGRLKCWTRRLKTLNIFNLNSRSFKIFWNYHICDHNRSF